MEIIILLVGIVISIVLFEWYKRKEMVANEISFESSVSNKEDRRKLKRLMRKYIPIQILVILIVVISIVALSIGKN